MQRAPDHALRVLKNLRLASIDKDERASRVTDVERLVVLIQDYEPLNCSF